MPLQKLYSSLASALIALSSIGVLRYVLGVSVQTAFFTGLIVTIVVLVMVTRRDPEPRADREILITLGLACIWIGTVFLSVYSVAPGGLFAIGVADNASHLSLIGEFLHRSPNVYSGFVIFVGMASGIFACLGLEMIDAISITIYSNVALALMFFAITSYKILGSFATTPSTTCLLALLPTLGIITMFNPLTYYNIGEGFWPHVCSIVVLAAAWAGQACLATPTGRITSLLISIALYRFFYGLNLGDLFVTTAILIACEARHYKPLTKMLVFIASLSLLGASFYGYSQLLPLAQLNGGIAPHARGVALTMAILLSIVGLLSWRLVGHRARGLAFESIAFPLIFSLVSACAEWGYDRAGLPENYYIFKYGLHRTLLLSIAAPLVAGFLLTTLLRATRDSATQVIAPLMLFTATLCAGFQLYTSYASYRIRFNFLPLLTDQRLLPELLFSKVVVSTIRDVLKREDKPYIATIGTQFPSIPFLNTYMTHEKDGHAAVFKAFRVMDNGVPKKPPQAGCVFWLKKGPFHATPLYFPKVRESVAAYHAKKKKRCDKKVDERAKAFAICYSCG